MEVHHCNVDAIHIRKALHLLLHIITWAERYQIHPAVRRSFFSHMQAIEHTIYHRVILKCWLCMHSNVVTETPYNNIPGSSA